MTRSLTNFDSLRLDNGTLLLALTGWMDGGLVSSGTVRQIMEGRQLVEMAQIEPSGYYIDNFPGSMEIATLFRPTVTYIDGLIANFEMPTNQFWADPANNMAFFVGKEPNLNWPGFGDCIFEICARMNIKRIIFMGSFGGSVPHTREPRMFGSVSDRKMLPMLAKHDLKPSNYEGPASFATYLLSRSPRHSIDMLSIAVEIPGYLHGANPLSIETVTRRISRLLNLPVDVNKLRQTSNTWEQEVSEAVEKDEELAETVRKLEVEYDNSLIQSGEVE